MKRLVRGMVGILAAFTFVVSVAPTASASDLEKFEKKIGKIAKSVLCICTDEQSPLNGGYGKLDSTRENLGGGSNDFLESGCVISLYNSAGVFTGGVWCLEFVVINK